MFFGGQGEDTMFIFGCLEHEARCKNEKKPEAEKRGKNLPRPWNEPQRPQFRKRRIVWTVKLWWPGSVNDVYSRFQEVGDWWLVIGGFLCFSWKQQDITLNLGRFGLSGGRNSWTLHINRWLARIAHQPHHKFHRSNHPSNQQTKIWHP